MRKVYEMNPVGSVTHWEEPVIWQHQVTVSANVLQTKLTFYLVTSEQLETYTEIGQLSNLFLGFFKPYVRSCYRILDSFKRRWAFSRKYSNVKFSYVGLNIILHHFCCFCRVFLLSSAKIWKGMAREQPNVNFELIDDFEFMSRLE